MIWLRSIAVVSLRIEEDAKLVFCICYNWRHCSGYADFSPSLISVNSCVALKKEKRAVWDH
jgi:hypothetical protein